MPFYPILSAPGCVGRTTLSNFAPNNWEYKSGRDQFVILTWLSDSYWHSVVVDELHHGEAKSYQLSDFSSYLSPSSLPLLSLSSLPYKSITKFLPSIPHPTRVPVWRSTIELYTPLASSSYQGELDPFPVPSSLLSFSPLIQPSNTIRNFLLFLNIEKEANLRTTSLQIFNSSSLDTCIGDFMIKNNNVNIIPLDNIHSSLSDISVSVSTEMSGVPIYLSIAADGSCLSLEHTHPPASFFIHGQRWLAQRSLKRRWFSRLVQK